jgi:hypothetical protein
MPGLGDSIWARGTSRNSTGTASSANTNKPSFTPAGTWQPSETPPQAPLGNGPPHHSPVTELQRFTRITRRMKWKMPFLDQGYILATNRLGLDPVTVNENELMFKLDFFEYYMLCERALVHLQGVFDIRISRDAGILPPGPSPAPFAEHRFHANVLTALAAEANPLHQVLGTGEVFRQLLRAKDLRNRWKNADMDGGERPHKMPAPLETYDLSTMLNVILDGLERGFAIAQEFVASNPMAASAAHMDSSQSSEELQWQVFVEAMDWNAI